METHIICLYLMVSFLAMRTGAIRRAIWARWHSCWMVSQLTRWHLSFIDQLRTRLEGNGWRNSVSSTVSAPAHSLIYKNSDKVIPRQLFEVPIQAAVGKKVIARETLKALRADVTAGLYGGHYERKLKHLDNQKEGKRLMKKMGKVELPQEAFFDILRK